MYKFKKLRTKVALLMIVGFIIPMLVGVGIFFYFLSGETIQSHIDNENIIVDEEKNIFSEEISKLSGDILFLSQLTDLKSIINNIELENDQTHIGSVQNEFYNFVFNNPEYYQLRYINEQGQEVIRIDNDIETVKIVKKEMLQNKKGRYYFDESVKIQEGEIYFSPIDLNIERGEIENRGTELEPKYVPVLRIATPVYDTQGKSRGIIISNIYMDEILNNLAKSSTVSSFYLVNSEGYYLFNEQNPDLEWGFMFDNDNNEMKFCPKEFTEMLTTGRGQLFAGEKDCQMTYARFNLASNGTSQVDVSDGAKNTNQFYILYSKYDRGKALEGVYSEISRQSVVVLFFLVFLIIIAYFFSKSITSPIKELVEGANQMAEGNFSFQVKVSGRDEIAALGNATNETAKKLKNYKENMDKEVDSRTADIKKTNELMMGREIKMLELKQQLEKEKKKQK